MWLDLREILEVPGAQLPFRCELDGRELSFPAVRAYVRPIQAQGAVRNSAGVLGLDAEVRTRMLCVCDRCGRAFERDKKLDVHVTLSPDMDSEDEAEVFPVTGDGVDVGEILSTCFILDMDAKCLCRDDCKGLCPRCGKDLNEGPCACGKAVDPRLAVLGQLLDKK